MEQKQLIPFMDCFTVDLTNNIIALHETGHVITMYALGMMDRFEYVTIKAGNGTAICRFYHIPDENLCKIDYALIDTLLAGLGLMVKSSDIQPLVDQYLNPIFASFDLLTKAVYTNLVEFGTLHKEQIMQIIKEWEEYKLL